MAWWQYPTNYSNGTSVEGVYDFFFGYPTTAISNYFGIGIIILIWSGFFALGVSSGTKKAMLIASFISFVMSIYLFTVGLLNPVVPIILIVLTIVGAILSKGEDSGGL